MTACFEPMHMLQKMPFHEIMRISLLGAHERMSAQRAYEIGLVSEVVPAGRAARRGRVGRGRDRVGTRRSRSRARCARSGRRRSSRAGEALDFGKVLIRVGSDPKSLFEGQKQFTEGRRIEPRIR